jgi:hypothetical protein
MARETLRAARGEASGPFLSAARTNEKQPQRLMFGSASALREEFVDFNVRYSTIRLGVWAVHHTRAPVSGSRVRHHESPLLLRAACGTAQCPHRATESVWKTRP